MTKEEQVKQFVAYIHAASPEWRAERKTALAKHYRDALASMDKGKPCASANADSYAHALAAFALAETDENISLPNFLDSIADGTVSPEDVISFLVKYMTARLKS